MYAGRAPGPVRARCRRSTAPRLWTTRDGAPGAGNGSACRYRRQPPSAVRSGGWMVHQRWLCALATAGRSSRAYAYPSRSGRRDSGTDPTCPRSRPALRGSHSSSLGSTFGYSTRRRCRKGPRPQSGRLRVLQSPAVFLSSHVLPLACTRGPVARYVANTTFHASGACTHRATGHPHPGLNLTGGTYKSLLSKWKVKPMEPLSPEVSRTAGELRALLGRLSRRLRQTSVAGELTLPQASVLSLLEREGPATPGALATKERITPQSMGAILVSLEALGLVSRTPDPTDGRRLVISLTEAGRQVILGARRQKEERLAQAFATNFTNEEQRMLKAALPLLERLARMR